MMQKKRVNTFLREKLDGPITFWGDKIDKKFFYKSKSGQFLLLLKKVKISATLDPQIVDGKPFSTGESQKRRLFEF